MSKTVMIDSQYFPSIEYTRILFAYSHIKIDIYEKHQKGIFRNRCRVAGSNGVIDLSVPLLKGRDQKACFRDLQISYHQNWILQHWRTVTSCYSKAPFFEYYAPGIQAILEKRFAFLWELNWHTLQWLQKATGLEAVLSQTEQPEPACPQDSCIDMRGKNYWQQSPLPAYYQLFEDRIGFQPNLSILDLLFMEGPAARAYLSR